ncbi:MAG: hypothetical protein M1813_008678 [Trichoglossum hirsutum]|nr:MAG: hypothetical protein M1813_008678 [Trichoglossum hirsutum]
MELIEALRARPADTKRLRERIKEIGGPMGFVLRWYSGGRDRERGVRLDYVREGRGVVRIDSGTPITRFPTAQSREILAATTIPLHFHLLPALQTATDRPATPDYYWFLHNITPHSLTLNGQTILPAPHTRSIVAGPIPDFTIIEVGDGAAALWFSTSDAVECRARDVERTLWGEGRVVALGTIKKGGGSGRMKAKVRKGKVKTNVKV